MRHNALKEYLRDVSFDSLNRANLRYGEIKKLSPRAMRERYGQAYDKYLEILPKSRPEDYPFNVIHNAIKCHKSMRGAAAKLNISNATLYTYLNDFFRSNTDLDFDKLQAASEQELEKRFGPSYKQCWERGDELIPRSQFKAPLIKRSSILLHGLGNVGSLLDWLMEVEMSTFRTDYDDKELDDLLKELRGTTSTSQNITPSYTIPSYSYTIPNTAAIDEEIPNLTRYDSSLYCSNKLESYSLTFIDNNKLCSIPLLSDQYGRLYETSAIPSYSFYAEQIKSI
ncbi:hypothetical protein ACNVED_03940 [Legionella sp. D16C41]|uniref:hypothetical protein n=1 Tax=Legionella sp. D16C41 TaxID=3402688 RepID=UPI003AF804A8